MYWVILSGYGDEAGNCFDMLKIGEKARECHDEYEEFKMARGVMEKCRWLSLTFHNKREKTESTIISG